MSAALHWISSAVGMAGLLDELADADHVARLTLRIDYDDGSVTATEYGKPGPLGVLLAHGAGAGQDHPWMTCVAEGLDPTEEKILEIIDSHEKEAVEFLTRVVNVNSGTLNAENLGLAPLLADKDETLMATKFGQKLYAALDAGDRLRKGGLKPPEIYHFDLDLGFGLVINPPTPFAAVEPFVELCDILLVMSVHPGFGGQSFIDTAPLIVAFSIVPGRVSGRHGEERGIRYSDFEAGHAGQNLLLQAVALDLGGRTGTHVRTSFDGETWSEWRRIRAAAPTVTAKSQ